jgi:hypothetical protein
MSPIQIVLAAGIIFISVYMYRRIRSSILDTVLILLFLVVGIVFVIDPDITNRLAKMVGVQRGANLIFYTGFLFLFFLILKLYSRSKKLEQSLTELVRQISLKEAKNLSEVDR